MANMTEGPDAPRSYELKKDEMEHLKQLLHEKMIREPNLNALDTWSRNIRDGYGKAVIYPFEEETKPSRLSGTDRELQHIFQVLGDLQRANRDLYSMVTALRQQVAELQECLELARALDVIKKLAIDLQTDES